MHSASVHQAISPTITVTVAVTVMLVFRREALLNVLRALSQRYRTPLRTNVSARISAANFLVVIPVFLIATVHKAQFSHLTALNAFRRRHAVAT